VREFEADGLLTQSCDTRKPDADGLLTHSFDHTS